MTDESTIPSADPGTSPLSRRILLGGGAALGVGLAGLGAQRAAAQPIADSGSRGRGHGYSVGASVRFLQGVTDAYRSSGMRLAQSYQDASGLNQTAFVYDNALAIIALLAGGDRTRARAIGDALIYAQKHDPETGYDNRRLRQAYAAGDFVEKDADGNFVKDGKVVVLNDFSTTAVGDMAWAGVAMAQLARTTGGAAYRTAALEIGSWIHDENFSNTGLGGYTFGTRPDLQGFKSAEHNIDVYALFRLLAVLEPAKRSVWYGRAQHAWDFVEKLWNAEDGYFYTGSNDGATPNTSETQRPLDVQTWAWLAARPKRYAEMLDWAATNLAVTDTPARKNSKLTGNFKISGVAFGTGSLLASTEEPIDPWNGNPDSGAVWFEGTAQLALALRDRRRGRDQADAEELLAEIRKAQRDLGSGQKFNGKSVGGGIVAASSPLNTGFGFGYFQNLHVGATSWYVMAGTRTNPYLFR